MIKNKIIGVVTGSRSDYGLLKELIYKIYLDKSLKLKLFVTGSHLSSEFGKTIKEVNKDKFKITDKVEILLSSDTNSGIAKTVGLGVISFTESFKSNKIDVLIILGDRFEIFSAVQAAFFLNIKTVHIHGGEITEGVLDDSIRHSISKLSHLHFVTAQKHKQLLIKMGESPNTIFNVGAPGLDLIKKIKFITKNKLEEKLSLKFDKHIFLVTFHPLTLNIDDYLKGLNELFEALNFFKNTTIIFTYSNADVGGRRINGLIREYSSSNDNVKVYSSLGSQNYLSLMKISNLIIGNSSSGIIEAPFLKKATINIGDRQKGRICSSSIINVKENKNAIIRGIKKAMSNKFISSLNKTKSLYGNGNASKKMLQIIKTKDINIKKKFYE